MEATEKIQKRIKNYLKRRTYKNIVIERKRIYSKRLGFEYKSPIVDISGKIFNNWYVIERAKNDEEGNPHWYCLCLFCFREKIVIGGSIKSGESKSCGCTGNESYIAYELKEYFIKNHKAKSEYNLFKNPKTKMWFRCDIYIPKYKMFIEVHGRQHYEVNSIHIRIANKKGISAQQIFEYQQYKDEVKKEYMENNGIYIEIDLRVFITSQEAIDYIENIMEKVNV